MSFFISTTAFEAAMHRRPSSKSTTGPARSIGTLLLFCITLLFLGHPALAQFTQQGPKLVGTASGMVGAAEQGWSVAISADGNTAIVGGKFAYSGIGAAWIYVRSGGVWTQQGQALVGPDAVDNSAQGTSVGISADGNTAIVGGPGDNGGIGAVWLWRRNGGVWTQLNDKMTGAGSQGNAHLGSSVALSADGTTAVAGAEGDHGSIGAMFVFQSTNGVWAQQGNKLVGTNAVGGSSQGWSVSVSADGNTALLGGYQDNNSAGAAWVFTRGGTTWTQQGDKLVGNDATGAAAQGWSAALSADGNTAIVGGFSDNVGVGAAWVYTRSGGVWSQQGSKLVGTGYGPANTSIYQGMSVSLSGNGNTAIVGGPFDSQDKGAVWVFTRVGGTWTQQGSKLAGSGSVGNTYQGWSAALSADGKTAVWGGYGDNGTIGAAWVFARSSNAAHDFNGDGKSDILWQDGSGNVAMWLMNGPAVTAVVSFGNVGLPDWKPVGQRDFNGDGNHDILWRDHSGNLGIWLMNGSTILSGQIISTISLVWTVVGTPDLNGDGKSDILWRDGSGNLAVWFMDGPTIVSAQIISNISLAWTVIGTPDLNGDGKSDILWRDGAGNLAVWFMNGATILSGPLLGTVPLAWSVIGTGDFNGDGKSDLLWRDVAGNVAVWLMNGSTISSATVVGTLPANSTWFVTQTGDYNGDGKSDILWRDGAGNIGMWLMNGAAATGVNVGNVAPNWVIQGANAD